jgi:DNA-binding response OmpR family regulator
MPRYSILIVEDDPDSARSFETMLRAHGHTVRTAGDAEAGLREIQREAPDVALVDLHLPLADGVEFVRQLLGRRDGSPVPVALMTGDYLVDDRVTDELHALGVPLHFKPLWEEDVLAIVAKLAGQHANCPLAAK